MAAAEYILFVLSACVVAGGCAAGALTAAGTVSILRWQNRWRLMRRAYGYGSDPLCEIGITLVASDYTDLEQVERRLDTEYARWEVVLVADSSQHADFDRLLARYDMIGVDYDGCGELPCSGVAKLYRSRKRRYRRLVVVERGRTRLCDDFNCGANVATYEHIVALDRYTELTAEAAEKWVVRMQEFGHGEVGVMCGMGSGPRSGIRGALAVAASAGWGAADGVGVGRDAVPLFDRNALIALGGYRDAPAPGYETARRFVRLRKRLELGRAVMIPDLFARRASPAEGPPARRSGGEDRAAWTVWTLTGLAAALLLWGGASGQMRVTAGAVAVLVAVWVSVAALLSVSQAAAACIFRPRKEPGNRNR